MGRVLLQSQNHIYGNESQVQASTYPPPSPVSNNGFPILAIAVLGIMATIFLLVSYYIFITKCCFFSWQTLDPLRRFSFRRPRQNDDLLMPYSPSIQCRGLDELLIREIPTFQYSRTAGEENSLFKCVVCLNEFQDQELLRLLPKCSHAFHLDCIDIWLQNNANCPLCRTSISGHTRDPLEMITAPNSSPQEPQPFIRSLMGSDDEDFVVIEVNGDEGNLRLLQGQQDRSDSYRQTVQSRTHSSGKSDQKLRKLKPRKFHHVSIMGDECINLREKDDQFSIQPIRRSFSMDSAPDRQVFLSVQETIRHNRHLSESRNNEESSSRSPRSIFSSSRSQRSIFSFGHSRGSRHSVLSVAQL